MHPLIAGTAALLSDCRLLVVLCTVTSAFWQLLSHIFLSALQPCSANQDFFPPFL